LPEPFDHLALVFRQDLGLDVGDPELCATAFAVVALSPVSITTRIPASFSAEIAAGVVALIGSAMARILTSSKEFRHFIGALFSLASHNSGN
jgi:hypothetical protein